MSEQAKINSVAVLQELRGSLAKFAETASLALDEASSEIQRTLTWLNEDRRRHWTKQVQLRQERYVQAKLALKRKGIFDLALAGMRSSAIDEKKALAIAERHLREAERRLARTRAWILRIEKELSDYRAASQGLSGALEVDIPNARARLEKMAQSLEAYVTLAPPETARGPGEKILESIARSRTALPTIVRSSPISPDTKDHISALRQRSPSLEVRQTIGLGADVVQWIDAIKPSEALMEAMRTHIAEPTSIKPEEKILLSQSEATPGTIYLEHTEGEEGDSGWYIGSAGPDKPEHHAAVQVGDLLQRCPALAGVLHLPAGYLVLMDIEGETEALFDPEDRLVWPTDSGRNVVSPEEPPEVEETMS